jgi:voltage-dependent potassium channel beta subunit
MMQYNQLGKAGIKLSELSFGSWITFGKQLDTSAAKKLMKVAFEHGVNSFDNAEGYAEGQAETLMGEALKAFRREEVVVTTKLFVGGNGPNDRSLSRKHLMEGIHNSLKRLQLDYVDLLLCHFPDPQTPMEEIVQTMDMIIRSGKALYWGTSKWSAEEIESAYNTAKQLHCIPPTVEQAEYNMFHHQRVDEEFLPLYEKYGLGIMTWSPLASGVLTGKYNRGIPEGSRLATETWGSVVRLRDNIDEAIKVTTALHPIAEKLNCSLAQLGIAWCLKNKHVNSVILGASNEQQLLHNLTALNVKEKLSEDVMGDIHQILQGYQEK